MPDETNDHLFDDPQDYEYDNNDNLDLERIDQIDPSKDYYEELVGEGKKFKDAQAIARGKVESDLFIESLKGELQELRGEFNKRMALEDVLERIEQRTNAVDDHTPINEDVDINGDLVEQTPDDSQKGNSQNNSKNLSPEDVDKLVESKIAQREATEQIRKNIKSVKDKLTSLYGDSYNTVVQQRAEELGLGVEYLQDVAKNTPNAFFAIIGENPTQGSPVPRQSATGAPTSSVSIPGRTTQTEHTQSYHDELRRTNPKEYFSAKASLERHADAQRLGEAFFDTKDD